MEAKPERLELVPVTFTSAEANAMAAALQFQSDRD
jgi:hypothetical protein